MPIQAQTSDGTIHEFPDGTPNAVIDKAMGEYTKGLKGKAEGLNPMIPGVEPGLDPKSAGTLLRTAGQGIPIAGGFIPETPETQKFAKEMPIAHAVTKGVGAAAALAPAMLAAPEVFGLAVGRGLMANTASGMASQGALGAADAAARGEPVVQGGVSGALMGGALPITGKGVGAVFQGVLNILGPRAPGVLKGVNPQALEKAASAAKSGGLTDTQIANMLEEKGPLAFLGEFTPDLYGQTRAIAGLPAKEGNVGKAALVKGFEDRVAPEAQHDRLKSGLDTLFGKSPVNTVQEKIQRVDDRKATADPLFERFKTLKVQPTPGIKTLTTDLEGLGLFNDAKRIALEKSAGGTPTTFGENFFTTGERKDWPTASDWQHLKEAVDQRIRGSYNNKGDPTGETRRYKAIKDRIDDEIAKHPNKDVSKAWTDAREAWATPSGVMNAAERGKRVWNDTYRKDQLLEDLTNLSQAERQAFKDSAQAELEHKLGRPGNADSSVQRMLLGPNETEKLRYLTENKTSDTKAFINSLKHEKGYEERTKKLGESSEGIALDKATADLTADPTKTLTARALERVHYSPHVTPATYLPIASSLKASASRRQEKEHEAMRDALGQLLAKQGPEAQEIAKALLRYAPLKGQQAGLTTTGIAQALARPSEPKVPVPWSPQYGGTQ